MADKFTDLSDYQEAIETMVLDGEELEATFPAALDPKPDSTEPKMIAITSHRLIVCGRNLRRGSSDLWLFTSLPFSRIQAVQFDRREELHRDRIDPRARVTVVGGGMGSGSAHDIDLNFRDAVMAREVHDRILAHMLGL